MLNLTSALLNFCLKITLTFYGLCLLNWRLLRILVDLLRRSQILLAPYLFIPLVHLLAFWVPSELQFSRARLSAPQTIGLLGTTHPTECVFTGIRAISHGSDWGDQLVLAADTHWSRPSHMTACGEWEAQWYVLVASGLSVIRLRGDGAKGIILSGCNLSGQ